MWGRDIPRGPRAGIGAHGQAPNLPPGNSRHGSPNGPGPGPGPGFGPPGSASPAGGEKYSLFMSGIPAAVEDKQLHALLESVGPVLKVNRIRDASGKPKGFGFVEYGDPESVLRCLELVNGVSLMGMDGEEKSITIKADAKVRQRLDDHEAGRMKTSEMDDQTAVAKATVEEVLDKIRTASKEARRRDDVPEEGEELNPDGSKKFVIPEHLRDLAPDELPEESRGLITSEIALFRERAMKREEAARQAEAKRNAARKQAEEQQRAFVMRQDRNDRYASPQGGGDYRSQPPTRSQREFDDPRQQQRDSFQDPQSYNRPVGFVASSSNQPRPPDGLTDEEAEMHRQRRKAQEAEHQYRTRLQRWEGREKSRIQALDRDKQSKNNDTQSQERRRQEMLEKCATFDDDEEMERGKELFLVDRPRWRSYRQAARRREIEQDKEDARLEAEEAEALKKESEDFLNRQAELFASMTRSGQTDGSGSGSGGEQPTKLKLAPVVSVDAKKDDGKAKPRPKAAIFGGADEDEEDGKKKKRELIRLDYSDDEDEAKKAEKKKIKVQELVSAIPQDKESLWAYPIRWEKLSEPMIAEKVRPFVAKKSVEYLGSEEEEVIDTVVDHMRAHKGPSELAEELEPLLAEEAEEFVIKVYRMLNFELLSALHGVVL